MFNYTSDAITDIKIDYDSSMGFLARNIRILLPQEKIDFTKEIYINLFEED